MRQPSYPALFSLLATLLLPAASALAQPAPATAPSPATSPDVPQTITSPLGKKMTLKFHDEFNAVPDKDGQPYIDRTKWQTTFWQGSSERTLTGNGEAQYYMDKDYLGKNNIPVEQRPNPFSFEQPGILTISAFKTPQELWGNYWMGKQRCFTSGLLISDRRFTFKYGYVEGRFKLPAQRGTWPAFWLLPDDPSRVKEESKQPKDVQAHPWPPEVDIFEFFGHRPTKFTTGYIAPKPEKVKVSRWMQEMPFDISQDYHTWGFEWDENTAIWTFDGKEVARGDITPSFRCPMYILINLAVGGNWYTQEMKTLGKPCSAWEVDESTMPWKMQCDYVRVYQVDEAAPPAK